jgi:hypothetical protein
MAVKHSYLIKKVVCNLTFVFHTEKEVGCDDRWWLWSSGLCGRQPHGSNHCSGRFYLTLHQGHELYWIAVHIATNIEVPDLESGSKSSQVLIHKFPWSAENLTSRKPFSSEKDVYKSSFCDKNSWKIDIHNGTVWVLLESWDFRDVIPYHNIPWSHDGKILPF